jgi:hypothetical protein
MKDYWVNVDKLNQVPSFSLLLVTIIHHSFTDKREKERREERDLRLRFVMIRFRKLLIFRV